jgi:hypothetical protein
VKRNTIVLSATLFLLAAFAWAGWANWEYRKQAADKQLAMVAKAELVEDNAGDEPHYLSPWISPHPPSNWKI